MDELALKLADGTGIVVPRSLDSLTTYVLLEQETWIEKETAILDWFAPGMTAIDIGANLGIYSLPIARRVAPGGQVFAYEPASETRAYLGKSRERNGLRNLHILPCALSDRPREGRLAFSDTSELHQLGDEGAGETVAITSLDEEDRIRAWQRVDFVKIDAEGEEIRIVEGGKEFFARHSPLVMFEVKSGTEIDLAIPEAFRAIGYRVFRLLNGMPLLVPVESGEPVNPYELNLFAAKPDRAALLVGEGRLIERVEPWPPDDAARDRALDLLREQVFARAFESVFAKSYLDSAYRNALAGYAVWRSPGVTPALRYGALQFAFDRLNGLCRKAATAPRLSTLARVAWEAGYTSIAVEAMNAIQHMMQSGRVQLVEPFWPADPRYDGVAPGAHISEWFAACVLEQFERRSDYSAVYSGESSRIAPLLRLSYAGAEMERRRILPRLKAGERVIVPERLLRPGPDHVNAEVWREGLVPNAIVPER